MINLTGTTTKQKHAALFYHSVLPFRRRFLPLNWRLLHMFSSSVLLFACLLIIMSESVFGPLVNTLIDPFSLVSFCFLSSGIVFVPSKRSIKYRDFMLVFLFCCSAVLRNISSSSIITKPTYYISNIIIIAASKVDELSAFEHSNDVCECFLVYWFNWSCPFPAASFGDHFLCHLLSNVCVGAVQFKALLINRRWCWWIGQTMIH